MGRLETGGLPVRPVKVEHIGPAFRQSGFRPVLVAGPRVDESPGRPESSIQSTVSEMVTW
jgi:hypothetical protein